MAKAKIRVQIFTPKSETIEWKATELGQEVDGVCVCVCNRTVMSSIFFRQYPTFWVVTGTYCLFSIVGVGMTDGEIFLQFVSFVFTMIRL